MAAPTLADLKTHLDITDTSDDVELAVFLASARSQIERCVGALTPATFTEVVNARGAEFLLSHRPLVAVTTVTGFGPTVAPLVADLAVNPAAGVVFRADGGYIYGRLSVTYTAGLASVPDAVFLAVLVTARHLWNMKRGNTRREFDDGTTQSSGAWYALPLQAQELIAPYAQFQGIA